MRMLHFIIANLLLISLVTSSVLAGEFSLPAYVTPEMGDPLYWAGETPEEILATPEEIQTLNELYLSTSEAMMTNLAEAPTVFNGKDFIETMWGQLYGEASGMIFADLYNEKDQVLTGKELSKILQNIDNGKNTEAQRVQYGICTCRTSLKCLPTDRLMASTKGDYEDDYNQNSLILVNEPVLIKATSLDGEFYYCVTTCYSGWAHSKDIAICADREEWLKAWMIPAEETLVVTGGKIVLDDSGFNPAVSGLQLSMGTLLQKVPQSEIGTNINGRFPFFNYVVYLPVRKEDGSYERTMGLIAKHQEVSDGFLPLTTQNLLSVAFSALGDVYGWGGMLSSMDCSTFVRCIYRCFGLSLALNTTWQQNLPGYQIDLSSADETYKKQILSALKPGAVLFFNGHEMLYLGEERGRFYCISAVGNMLDASARGQSNIRTITINTLDVTRLSGHTWLEDINNVLIPYLPMDAILEEIEAIKAEAPLAEEEAAASSEEMDLNEELFPVEGESLELSVEDMEGENPENQNREAIEETQAIAGNIEETSSQALPTEENERPEEGQTPEGLPSASEDLQASTEKDVEEMEEQESQSPNEEGSDSVVVLDYLGNEFQNEGEDLEEESPKGMGEDSEEEIPEGMIEDTEEKIPEEMGENREEEIPEETAENAKQEQKEEATEERASQEEASKEDPNILSQSLLAKELENPQAAAIRSQLNITTSFHDEEFLHGEKDAQYQKYIVLHDTCMYEEGEAVVQYWLDAGRKVAAHFIVNRDGSIVQTAPLDQILHHVGWGDEGKNEAFQITEDGRDDREGTTELPGYTDYAMNSYSIGIEISHMDPEEGEEQEYTPEQLEALDGVIAYIDAYYGFESEIITHKDWRESNSDTAASFDKYLVNYQDHRSHKDLAQETKETGAEQKKETEAEEPEEEANDEAKEEMNALEDATKSGASVEEETKTEEKQEEKEEKEESKEEAEASKEEAAKAQQEASTETKEG